MTARASEGAKKGLERCPSCSGVLDVLGLNRLQHPIQHCRSCGRDFGRAANDDAPRRVVADTASVVRPITASSKPCPVDGCPGTVAGSAAVCECCVKRATWMESHAPKRDCDICGGKIASTRNQKYCKACKPLAQKVQIASSKKVGASV